jgi:hypothetical protein
MSSRPTGPVTWPEVIAKLAPLHEDGLDFFDDLPENIESATPPRWAGDELSGFDASVAALAVLRGSASVMPQLRRVGPLIPRIVHQLGDRLDADRALAALTTLRYLNVARCCGTPITTEAGAAELHWIPQLADLRGTLGEYERHSVALAACAASLTSLVGPVADTRVPRTFVAGQSFGFDVAGFTAYLASAIDHGASYQDVDLAWLDFVHRFPYKLDTNVLDWPSLLYAARAVYATIGGLPEGEVADELHRLVTGA